MLPNLSGNLVIGLERVYDVWDQMDMRACLLDCCSREQRRNIAVKRIYVRTFTVVLLFGIFLYLILSILLPVTYRRTFYVSAASGRNYILECYVPGRADHAIVDNNSGRAHITYRAQNNGTLVRIETKSQAEFMNFLEFSIWFVPEDDAELLSEYPAPFSYVGTDEKEKYYILENGKEAATLGAYDRISEGKDGAKSAVIFSATGFLILLCVHLAAVKSRKKGNLSYSSLVSITEEYFEKNVRGRISSDQKLWLEKRMKRNVFLQSCMAALAVILVSGMPLWLDSALQFWVCIRFVLILFFAGAIMKRLLALYTVGPVTRITLTEKTALEIWWYRYRLHDLEEGYGMVWALSDLLMALDMTAMRHPEESYEFAERIWKRFGWKLTEGEWYFMYHLIQQTNCRLLGKAEEEKIHRQEMEKEKNRKPKKALYQKLLKTAESIK